MRRQLSTLAIVLYLFLYGCYPPGPETYEELDIVNTNYTEDFEFQSQKTYAMPVSIVKITGSVDAGGEPDFIKEPYNTQILQRIESNMNDLGWQKVDDPQSADLVLMPASWTNTTIYYWYDYWCWYYPYYCGWGWYYPVSSYTTGTLVMTLIADGEEYIEPTRVWLGAINGLLSGTYDTNRINTAIDQTFMQSPYLDVN